MKGLYSMGGVVCTQTTIILNLKRSEKIWVIPFTLFVDGKYFMLLMPSVSHHSSPPQQTKLQIWHCLCYAYPCSSFSAKETLPYITIRTTSAVLKVPVASLCFPPVSLAVMPEQQDFVPDSGLQRQHRSHGMLLNRAPVGYS